MSAPNTQKLILPGTPVPRPIRFTDNFLKVNKQPSHCHKIQKRNRNQRAKHLPKKANKQKKPAKNKKSKTPQTTIQNKNKKPEKPSPNL